MTLTATKLRQNLYRILDDIIETGVSVEVKRNGEILKIVPEKKKSKLERLKVHRTIIGEPESLININFNDEWKEKDKL